MRMKRLAAVLCGLLAASALSAAEVLRFDADVFTLVNRKGPGADELTAGAAPLPGDAARTAAYVGWETSPAVIEAVYKNKSPEFTPFDRGEFTLTVRPAAEAKLRRIVLRLIDRTGETFQYTCPNTGVFPAEAVKLVYLVDPALPPDSVWGGNKDRKIDWPLRFAGFAVDFAGKNAPGRIYVESLEFRLIGEEVSFRLDTGHSLNLLLPNRKNPPELVFANAGTEAAELTGELRLTDPDGPVRTDKVECTVPAGNEVRLPVSGDFSKQGCWKAEAVLRSQKTGRELRGEFRFARMNPAGPTPGRAKEFLFGVCSHPERFSPQEGELEAVAAGLCGAKIVRVDFAWARIQPKPDVTDFSVYDRLVEAFGRNGVEMQCLLGYSTRWAVPKEYQPKNPALKGQPLPDAKAYAAFCATVAERYKDRIKYFEFWNEPDLIVFANFSAADYMNLLRHGYDAVKKVAPESKLMNGGIAAVDTNDSGRDSHNNGLFELLLADGGKHFDLFAWHGHGPYPGYVDNLNVLEKKYGLVTPDKPWGWYSNETAVTSAAGSEKIQAETLFRKLLYAWSRGAMGYNWYNLREKSYYPLGHYERHFGLITAEFEPKPAYVTYNMLANTFRGGKFRRELPLGGGLRALLFEDAKQRGVLALWSEGGDRTLFLAGMPEHTEKLDLYGNETQLEINNGLTCLKVSASPFALRMPAIPAGEITAPGELFSRALPGQLALTPGKPKTFPVPLANPTTRPLAVTVKAEPPEHIAADGAGGRVTLRPGEKKDVEIRLTAAEAFDASPTAPAKLTLRIEPEGLRIEPLTFPVVRQSPGGGIAFRLDNAEQYYSLIESAPGNERYYWKGPDDLSADISLAKRGDALVVKAAVRDDAHVQPYPEDITWKADGIQFALRIPGQNRMWKFGLARLADGSPKVFCWRRPDGFSGTVNSIRLSTGRDEELKLTTYEAVIPFQAIGLTPEAAAAGIRFNAIVNDNDNDRRKGFLFIAPGLGTSDEDTLYPVVNLE